MNIFFRADASVSIGTGHIMRCMTLAQELMLFGHHAVFICRGLPTALHRLLEDKGMTVLQLQGDSSEGTADEVEALAVSLRTEYDGAMDWLIIDHYGIDAEWEGQVQPYANRMMVIDDLANRPHQCNVLLDQNYFHNMQNRYEGMLPAECKLLLGPSYALLRPEFIEYRIRLPRVVGPVKRMLIFFGGTDPTNETVKALRAIERLYTDIHIDVVVGAANPNRQTVEEMCERIDQCHYHCQVDYMALLMAQADLAIAAGGSATWERMYLGLPTLTIMTADNQVEMTNSLANSGFITNMGWHEEVTVDTIDGNIRRLLNHEDRRLKMSRLSLEYMEERSLDQPSPVCRWIMGAMN